MGEPPSSSFWHVPGVIALGLAVSSVGVILALAGTVYLVQDTRRLRASGRSDSGLGGARGIALSACLIGMSMSSAAMLILRDR